MLEDGMEAIVVEPDPEPVLPSEASRGRYSRKEEKKVSQWGNRMFITVSGYSPIASGSV
jgi:hypothetical protein